MAAPEQGYASKESFLTTGRKLAEEIVDVPGIGRMLVGELSGKERAFVIEAQALAQKDKGDALDIGTYLTQLLRFGVLDPGSPADARTKLFDIGDLSQLLEVGSGKLQALTDAIERLSGLGQKAVASAEGNSAASPSGSATSE